jgi:hypothetical protein
VLRHAAGFVLANKGTDARLSLGRYRPNKRIPRTSAESVRAGLITSGLRGDEGHANGAERRHDGRIGRSGLQHE